MKKIYPSKRIEPSKEIRMTKEFSEVREGYLIFVDEIMLTQHETRMEDDDSWTENTSYARNLAQAFLLIEGNEIPGMTEDIVRQIADEYSDFYGIDEPWTWFEDLEGRPDEWYDSAYELNKCVEVRDAILSLIREEI